MLVREADTVVVRENPPTHEGVITGRDPRRRTTGQGGRDGGLRGRCREGLREGGTEVPTEPAMGGDGACKRERSNEKLER